jgi:TrpR-related protein YerC/YecD
MTKATPKEIDSLYKTILRVESPDECRKFFRDLLTENEISEFALRWKAAQMLDQGIPYTIIVAKTGLSSRTIARVRRWLKEGRGGYHMMLERVKGF